MSRLRKIALLLMAATILMISAYHSIAFAGSVSELEEQQKEAESEAEELEKRKSALEEAMSELDSDFQQISAEITDLEQQIAECRELIADAEEQLAQAEEEAAEQYEQMKLRIRFMYENSNTNLLTLLLDADSFADFLNRVTYITALSMYDRERMDDYEATMNEIASYKETLEKEQEELLAAQEDLGVKQEALLTAISDKQDEIDDTDADIDTQEALLDSLADQIAAMEAYEEELELQKAREEAARLAAEQQKQEEEAARAKEEESETVSEEEMQTEEESEESSDPETSSEEESEGETATAPEISASDSEAELLAALIYCEAGGEPYEAQLAVGTVVLNRVSSSLFPNTITGVIYQSGQFTPAASGRLALVLENNLTTDSCRQAAQEVLAGTRSGTWLYFCVDTGLISGTVIGKQVFY